MGCCQGFIGSPNKSGTMLLVGPWVPDWGFAWLSWLDFSSGGEGEGVTIAVSIWDPHVVTQAGARCVMRAQLRPEHPSGKSMRNRISHAGSVCSGSSLWSQAPEVTILLLTQTLLATNSPSWWPPSRRSCPVSSFPLPQKEAVEICEC